MRLLEKGIAADEQSVCVFAERWAMARWRLSERMLRRLAGDWSDDEQDTSTHSQATPAPQPAATAPKAEALTWTALLERWAADRQRAPNTVKAYRATFRQLERVLGYADPRRVDGGAVLKFKEARRGEVSAKTLHTDITAAGAVFQWGTKFGLLTGNPFAGTTEKPAAPAEAPVRPYQPEEARRILEAARLENGWRRWLPWLLCFSGARISDIATLRRRDVQEVDGVWEMRLAAPDWRRGKTNNAPRRLPIHWAIIAEGFLEYLAKVPPDGPLFPDTRGDGDSARTPEQIGNKIQNAHARWVRSTAGVEDMEGAAQSTAPAHSWRHLLKDQMRRAMVPDGHQDAILGHAHARNAGAGYGDGLRNMPDATAPELNKVPSPIPPLGPRRDPAA
jgi:integrase